MTVEIIQGPTYSPLNTGSWYAPGRPASGVNFDRAQLVPGTYMANNPLTTGLLPGWSVYDLEPLNPPTAGATQRTFSVGGVVENKLIWGAALARCATLDLKFRNCAIAGWPGAQAAVKCYGTGYYQFEMEDCLIDHGLWMDPDLARPNGMAPLTYDEWHRSAANMNGMHGGRVTMRRTEIRRVSDSFSGTQTMRSADDNDFTLEEGNWYHENAYYFAADWAALGLQSDGNHADNKQVTTGHHHTARGNYYGGFRNEAGYVIYPNDPEGISTNLGDDAWNSGIIFTQQVNTDDFHRISDVLIEKNIFEGGKYCINHPQVSASVGTNDFHDTVVRDNLFVRRNDGVGNGALQTDGNYARYVNRYIGYASSYSNNRVIDPDGLGGYTLGEPIVYKNA